MQATRTRFRISALIAAAFAAFAAPPRYAAAQFGRVDVGDPKLNEALDAVETAIKRMDDKARGEFETLGKVSKDTQTAVDSLGATQKELADRLLKIEQSGSAQRDQTPADKSWGAQVTSAELFKVWRSGGATKVRFEVADEGRVLRNTLTGGTGGTVGAGVVPVDIQPGIIPGPSRNLSIEGYLASRTTTSDAVSFVRENTFTNSAAETVQGAQKPESSITFTPQTLPVQTIAHWIKISRQLAMDAPALTAYINSRMRYGVNKRAEDQIVSGNGTDPNIAGLLKSGNFTAHGYSDSALGTALGTGNKLMGLTRLIIADLSTSDYPADFILLNPVDWAKVELAVDANGNYLVGNPRGTITPGLWGLPVFASNAVPADKVIVMSRMAAAVYNREGVVVEMSESDADNFTKNLITIRAERRLMLAVEIPAAIRAGDFTPA